MRGRKVGHPVSQETRDKISKSLAGRSTQPCPPEVREKISVAQKGKPKPNLLGHLVSEETREKIAARLTGNTNGKGKRPETFRRKMSEVATARGENHNWFVDGRGDERNAERKASFLKLDYRLWREAVFSRDNYTCQACGVRGSRLQADHILPWKSHPDKRFDVNNGRTLCESCHKLTPTYGRR